MMRCVIKNVNRMSEKKQSWLDEGAAHVWRPYCQHASAPPPLPVVGAEGITLRLADGRTLLDGLASWWTAAHGYNRPEIAERVHAQLGVLAHVAFGGLAHEPAYTLATQLCALAGAPFERVFYTESGSVAVEVALKMALQWHQNRGAPRRTVLAFEGAYHGDTFATMSLCDREDGMHRAFRGTGLSVVHAPIPRSYDELSAAIGAGADLACIVIEPLLQAAGGMRVHDAQVLQWLRRAADACGALLVFDEIATGFHRLGPRFAFQQVGVTPDLLVIGKALTGGTLPLAATLASERVFAEFLREGEDGAAYALQHGPTYMGNALACTAALASLELFARDDYAARVQLLEQQLRGFVAPANVRALRVCGAMLALEMDPGSAPPSDAFAARGAFVRPLRLRRADVVYLMPSLTVTEAELEQLLTIVHATIAG